ncbi:hypothetical protein VOLCADRAFT_117128, partial [Volvox carteri f. nagariensis]
MPRVVKHNVPLDDDEEERIEESSTSEEEEDVIEEEESGDEEEEDDAREGANGSGDARVGSKAGKTAQVTARASETAQATSGRQPGAPGRLTVSLSGKNEVCKVCGKRGHKAGFVGATYLDCPNRPCYLCKGVGHTTATCPYRIAPGHGCTAAATAGDTATRGSVGGRGGCLGPGRNLCTALRSRECLGRCCALEFHPHNDSIVVSGDKKGALAVWNFDQVHDRTVYDTVHSCLTNSIRFLPWLDSMSVVTASSDGTSKLVDLETGDWRPLLDLNPGGWVQGGPWHMIYGCDASPALGVVLLHRKGNKVVSVHMHPLHPPLVLTAGNDHSARIFDIRELSSAPSAAAAVAGTPPQPPAAAAAAAAAAARIAVAGGILSASPAAAAAAGRGGGNGGGRGGGGGGGATAGSSKKKGGSPTMCSGSGPGAHAELVVMPHPRVVNSAYFSPHTGRRILTTCQDNRLRVWDYAPYGCNGPADREIVHSHDFNRYLTPFRGEWDPKDLTESVFVVGRYISEDFGGVALHPVDVLSASDGGLLRQLTDANLTTISPVNKAHPR